jgi:hypothetical protein
MRDPRIGIRIVLEADEDSPVADVSYPGDHWVSVTRDGDTLVVTVYGQASTARPLPVDAALESLEGAKQQLSQLDGDDASDDQLSTRDAYAAMFRFLEAYYARAGSDELGALLGGLAIDDDGRPMDPPAWTDWLAAVQDATCGGDLRT